MVDDIEADSNWLLDNESFDRVMELREDAMIVYCSRVMGRQRLIEKVHIMHEAEEIGHG